MEIICDTELCIYNDTSKQVCLLDRVTITDGMCDSCMKLQVPQEDIQRLKACQLSALLINESLDDFASGAQPIDGKQFFSDMKKKYS